ncbi:MAG: 23S rRNA (pseudouridine(1915)-N(3))-methyltransferase RlmH [Pseudomonadota bacterium]
MPITLLCVGRLKAGPERELFDRYWRRCQAAAPSLGLGKLAYAEIRESKDRNAKTRKAEEGAQLLDMAPSDGCRIVLDERGDNVGTDRLVDILSRQRDEARPIAIMIGGPDGLDDKVRSDSTMVLSFGRMTLPHQLVRVLMAEQLYRVLSIMSGHPYHRV